MPMLGAFTGESHRHGVHGERPCTLQAIELEGRAARPTGAQMVSGQAPGTRQGAAGLMSFLLTFGLALVWLVLAVTHSPILIQECVLCLGHQACATCLSHKGCPEWQKRLLRAAGPDETDIKCSYMELNSF